MKKLLFAVTLLALGSSCKKDKDKTCDLNAGSLVGSYKTTSVKYKASTSASEVDLFATYDACEKDDLVKFNSNNTVNYQDAGTVCTPPGDDTGIWALSGNTLTLDGELYTITSFDCNGMTLTNAGSTPGELTTITVVRQ